MGELFSNAFNRCSNLEKTASGFRTPGIYPIEIIDSIQSHTAQEALNPTQNIHMNIQPSDNHARCSTSV